MQVSVRCRKERISAVVFILDQFCARRSYGPGLYGGDDRTSSDDCRASLRRHMQLADVLCRQPKRAGVYLMGTDGEIPAHSTTYMETACSYNEPVVMHPFAYRTHAHTHGSSRSIARLAFYGRPK